MQAIREINKRHEKMKEKEKPLVFYISTPSRNAESDDEYNFLGHGGRGSNTNTLGSTSQNIDGFSK